MDLFDLHCDSPYESHKKFENFKDGNLAVTVEKGSIFNVWRQVCAIWVPDECHAPKKRYRTMLDFFKSQIAPALSIEDLRQKRAFFLSLEGGAPIDTIDDVDMLFNDGVRVVTLTWNGRNKIAGGCNTGAPLSDFGRQVISRMNEFSMAIDLSHLNDISFENAIELCRYPLASHSCCRNVYHVRRNMTDAQILKLTKKGGIIGLCLYPNFLGAGDPFLDFARHLYHLCEMGLENFLAIGSDFDGAKMDKRLDSIDKMPILYNYLINNGFESELLSKLFFKNAERYFTELLTPKITE